MKKSYDSIVVGGGIAGLTSAAYLCKYGYSTLLLEKEEKVGGLVNTFWYNGFAFDGGIRAFENSGILFPMLKSLDIDIDFHRSPVSIGIEDSWIKLSSRDSLEDYKDMLKSKFQDNAKDVDLIGLEIKKIMGYLDVIYGIDNPLFLENMKEPKYLFQTLLPWLLKYQVSIRKSNKLSEPVNDYLGKFTENKALIDMITQHFFKNTPTNFALSYFELYLDYSYPKGGTGVLAEKLAEYIGNHGGEILSKAKVCKVDNLSKVVKTEKELSFNYNKLIWAADQKTLYKIISTDDKEEVVKQREIVQDSNGGDSILTLFIGANMSKDKLENTFGAHGFFTPKLEGLSSLGNWRECFLDGQESFKDWVSDYLELTTYEISCPAMRDPDLAPEGKMGIIVSTLMDYGLVRQISDKGEYKKFKEFVSNKIIQVINDTLLQGLIENIDFTICSTPLTMEKITGNYQGAITGWEFTDKMPSENRFNKIRQSIETPIKDIFQCGQWTFSPSGLPVSVLTGKLAADMVKKTMEE